MVYDLIVIGAGPAGVSAAVYACSRGINTLVIEQGTVGGTLGMVSIVSHYTAIVENESGASIAGRMAQQLNAAGAVLAFETVKAVELCGTMKKVTTEAATYQAKSVILASGSTPRRLEIPGAEQLRGKGFDLNAARDGAAYTGKDVYVIGGADGAVKEALYLSRTARQVTIVHFEDTLGAIAEFRNMVSATPNIRLLLHTRLTALRDENGAQIDGLEFTDEKTGEARWEGAPGCGVFVYAGATPNTELYCQLTLLDGYIPANERMETGIPGVYAAGDICVKQVRQAATAVADGAIAAINAAAWLQKNL